MVTQVIHVTKSMLTPAPKDLLSAKQKSSVIYDYTCHCDNQYVERTFQHLQNHIMQHVFKWQIQHHTSSKQLQPDHTCKIKQTTTKCNSAISQYLIESSQYTANYHKPQFLSWI